MNAVAGTSEDVQLERPKASNRTLASGKLCKFVVYCYFGSCPSRGFPDFFWSRYTRCQSKCAGGAVQVEYGTFKHGAGIEDTIE